LHAKHARRGRSCRDKRGNGRRRFCVKRAVGGNDSDLQLLQSTDERVPTEREIRLELRDTHVIAWHHAKDRFRAC
jgi:hypothetical protein